MRSQPRLVHLAALAAALIVHATARADILGPRGIYALSNARDLANTPFDDRLTGIRDYDFVSGFTIRLLWNDLDASTGLTPAQQSYNFSVIANALAQLQPLGKKLSIEVLLLDTPAFVLSHAGQTWQHFSGSTLPVPWDPYAQDAYANFIHAMASFEVFDAAVGHNVPLSQHSALEIVDAPIVGIQSIRDNPTAAGQPPRLVTVAGYSRATFISAVLESLAVNRDAFADKYGFLGYFSMTDSQNAANGGKTLDQSLRAAILGAYDNPGQKTLGFFQELLSDAGPNPAGALGQSMLAVSDQTYILFQALTSWTNPFTNPAAVASGNPATGIRFGYDTYGATFFELYVSDLDNPALWNDLRHWNTLLTNLPEPGTAAMLGLAALTGLRRRR